MKFEFCALKKTIKQEFSCFNEMMNLEFICFDPWIVDQYYVAKGLQKE